MSDCMQKHHREDFSQQREEAAAASYIALVRLATGDDLKARARNAYLGVGGTEADFEQDWPVVRARILCERAIEQERERWRLARVRERPIEHGVVLKEA